MISLTGKVVLDLANDPLAAEAMKYYAELTENPTLLDNLEDRYPDPSMAGALGALVAADAELAAVSLRDVKAGIRDETPEWSEANRRSHAASVMANLVTPWWFRWWIHRVADRTNKPDWQAVWDAVAAADEAEAEKD